MEAKILESAGLTKNESIVYLTLLQIGTSRTGKILKSSKLNSGKIYEILNSLMNKGLVSESIIDNIKNFSAAPPNEIINYINKKKEALEKQETNIKSILPQLKAIKETKSKETKVFVYTGFKGFKTAVNEILKEEKIGHEHVGMGIRHDKPKKYNDYWLGSNRKTSKDKLKRRLLFSQKSKYQKDYSIVSNTKIRVLPNITPAAINVTGNKTLILNYEEEGTFVLIENKAIAKSFKNFFEQLWKIAKP